MNVTIAQSLAERTKELSLKETFAFICKEYPASVKFSTSFGQEDQIITDIIAKLSLPITIFTLDTGRLFQETYDVFHRTTQKYAINIKTYFPETTAVENLLEQKGPNSFYTSVENRKECCNIRKVEPLTRALKDCKVWITGLRAEQSANRNNLSFFEYDSTFNLVKFNPLLRWTLQDILKYIKENNVPQNILHKKGYISIGCAPCTRAIETGEDIRAGRWWWESSHKECGLHGK